jgi:hypothetical protein
MTYIIFLVDAIFENRVAQFVYMKNMSRKREIQKVKTQWLVFGDVFVRFSVLLFLPIIFAHYFCPLFLPIIFAHYFCPLFLSHYFYPIIFAHYFYPIIFIPLFLPIIFIPLFLPIIFAHYSLVGVICYN